MRPMQQNEKNTLKLKNSCWGDSSNLTLILSKKLNQERILHNATTIKQIVFKKI